MSKLIFKKGFTLIELLVVIAIIGILSGVVLTFVNSARLSARDARIKADLKSMRTVLELGYNGSSYVDLKPLTTGTSGLTDGALVATSPNYEALSSLRTDIKSQSGGDLYLKVFIAGTARANAWAIYSPHAGGSDIYFCIDSTGKMNEKADDRDTVSCPS